MITVSTFAVSAASTTVATGSMIGAVPRSGAVDHDHVGLLARRQRAGPSLQPRHVRAVERRHRQHVACRERVGGERLLALPDGVVRPPPLGAERASHLGEHVARHRGHHVDRQARTQAVRARLLDGRPAVAHLHLHLRRDRDRALALRDQLPLLVAEVAAVDVRGVGARAAPNRQAA